MLDLRYDIPIKQDVLERVETLHAQIRDLLIEQEQVLALAVDNDVLLTKEEVAQYLRCEVKKVPTKIPKIRIGNRYLYEKKDIDAFLQSKKNKLKI